MIVTYDKGIHRNHPDYIPVLKPGAFAARVADWEQHSPALRLGSEVASGRMVTRF